LGTERTDIDQRAEIIGGPVSPAGTVVEISAGGNVAATAPAIPGAARWHVIHTRSRQEKALARALTAAGIEHYLPLVRHARVCGHRTRYIDEPLFTSYLFVFGAAEATYLAVATRRVANVVKVADQARFLHEIQQIRRALDHGAELSPCPYLKVGRRARVTSGPFRGIEGMIEDLPKPGRLVLQIEALGRATSLEIDAGLLERVDWS
jgi:transcription antitermination factor NusG